MARTIVRQSSRITTLWLFLLATACPCGDAKLADRSRLVKHRQATGQIAGYHDNGHPIEGQSYRSQAKSLEEKEKRLAKERSLRQKKEKQQQQQQRLESREPQQQQPLQQQVTPWQQQQQQDADDTTSLDQQRDGRHLSSQLSGCCYTYDGYSAMNMCSLYGQDCESGETPSHDSGDDDCSIEGLSFIGISFSVNTASGNPYSYQLNDQFPMENIIDRDYEYVMSMDEDGWLVGGGYKTFDYSGKMPYVSLSFVLIAICFLCVLALSLVVSHSSCSLAA